MNIKPRPMSNQEAFNNVWKHFIIEGNPPGCDKSSYIHNCVYRRENFACAIGCQMPDNLAEKADGAEISDISSILRDAHNCDILEYFEHVYISLLEDLQDAHDYSAITDKGNFKEELRGQLCSVANRYGLKIF